MSFTLGQAITAARARHPAFDQSRVADKVLAAAASDGQNELLRKAVGREKTYGALSVTITINDTVFNSGSVLPGHVALVNGTVLYTDGNQDPLAFTTIAQRFDPPTFPAVYEENGVLKLTGANMDWVDVTSITVQYTPIIVDFAALADAYTLPDAAKPSVVAFLAHQCAVHAEAKGAKVDIEYFAAIDAKTETEYLSTLRFSKRSRVTSMREVEQ